ncbi:MAG: PRC-barrel domain-containing protein [Betaproteobacteria bacterium]
MRLALALALAAPAAAAGDEAATAKASALIGSAAKSPQGESLGRIRDLVVDLDDNRVRYAIVEVRNKLVRYSLVQFDPSPARDHVVFHVAKERLAESPGMDPRWKGFGLARASDLLGASIHDREGRVIGELTEMIVDWRDGTIPYAVAELGSARRIRLEAFSMRGDELVLEPPPSRGDFPSGATSPAPS